ncbi:hypothetical protein ACTO4W_09070, partial [Klebsiella michiganensis]
MTVNINTEVSNMSNLQESPVWADGIYQLTDETPVLGKQENVPGGGPSNVQAEQLANRTQWLKSNLLSIPDYREYTFYTSSDDPDGTIAGLAGTPDGKQFRVAQGSDADSSFIYYLNNSGVAVEVAKLPGQGAIEALIALINALELRVAPIQESPDALLDIVSRNGLRPFKIDDDNGETSLSLIARLLTGDSGLNFSGNILDNNAPEGWLFLIYAKNGLVIAGVKEDGTKVGWGGSDSGGGQAG